METAVGIVIPAYQPNVDRLTSYVEALTECIEPAVIRIELDEPTDEVLAALETLPVTVNAVTSRRGKGAAITSGFEQLDTDVLVFADADGSTPPASVAAVLEPVVDGTAALSVGSRRHPDAEVRSHQTRARRRLGDAFAWLARRALEVRLYDYQCGAKAISAESWNEVRGHLVTPGFAWDIELIAMAGALDVEVTEVPIVWEDQPESTVSPVATMIDLGTTLLTARHRAKCIAGNRLHRFVAARRGRRPSLVETLDVNAVDESAGG